MLELKPLPREGIPGALARVERYRLLNEPEQAESICQDILCSDPENQEAIRSLLLALTDQFGAGPGARVSEARELLPRLQSKYEQLYYAGIIAERRARAFVNHGGLGSGPVACQWFREAMHSFEEAETLRPAGNDDAILRWNTCARFLMRNPELMAKPDESLEPVLLE
ncbi:MAG TPA: hypothetical protein DEQ47_20435 [Solibacterales bacterium]|nr:hypothetical protein [Bryobacterales bacterium]